jgi:SNF2 family DNA or RNA helicase
LPPAARKIYEDLEEEMIAVLDNLEVVTALSAAAASMKCRQVANGGIYRQLDHTPAVHSDKWQNIHDAKTDALSDLVEELNGQPLLVLYEFNHDLDRIRKRFPKATYACDYTARDFPRIEKLWNEGKIEMLVAQPQSVGHGLNLQDGHAQHICFYSQIWDLEVYDQVILRICRQGNKSKQVFVYHIIANKTIDHAVLRSHARKTKVQNRLLDALKDYRLTRGN